MECNRAGPGEPLSSFRLCAMHLISRRLYAPGARHQFIELSKYAASQSKRHLKAQLGSGTDSTIPRIRVTNTLIIPSPNPFLEPAPLEVWERWFSPRR